MTPRDNAAEDSKKSSKNEDKDQEKSQTKDQEKTESEKEENKENDNKGHRGKRDGSQTARSKQSDKSDGSDGRSAQKEYFKEELKRLKSNLDKEASKINPPERQKNVPYVFNNLEPYYDVSTPRYLIELPEQLRHGYVSRQTALGLTDPWEDHRMDVELLPKIESRSVNDDNKEKSSKSPREKEGSTMLPKFPAVSVPVDDLKKNKTLDYGDVPMLREEIKKKIGANAEDRVNKEYDRTKKDFYRMELDKMEEYHPTTRPKMRATYFAYLQNNVGSKKAVKECVKEVEEKEKENENRKQKEKQREDNRRTGSDKGDKSRESNSSNNRERSKTQGKKSQSKA